MKDQDLMFLLIDPLQPSHTCTQTHKSPLLSLKVTQLNCRVPCYLS